jgi:hypothetical protein
MKIKVDSLDQVVISLLDKLNELESGVNANCMFSYLCIFRYFITIYSPILVTITSTTTANSIYQETEFEVFIFLEGEKSSEHMVKTSPTDTLQQLRVAIADQLDDFDFDFMFLRNSG